ERNDEQFDQQVAIKLIHAGMTNADMLLRFKSERQILASLSHPNIAHLVDGGNTSQGVPYLVMEYVDGEPFLDYCNRRNLGVDARLGLFQKVCDAVHYAHRNLVVHRDIKQSNILVAADGSPRLLDFGIAKLLGDSARHTVALTRADMRLLTPAHASPEQVQGAPITTSSDVYSLGVLLYNLLSGAPPYRIGNAGPRRMEELICDTVPPTPSESVAEDVAATHGQSAERVRRKLVGDLDTIVLMAMRKEPDRRYPSVRALSDDIERYRKRMPVVARPDTMGYRLSRFVDRHRAGLAASVAVTAVIAALVTFYTMRLSDERDRARLQASRAEQVSRFLTNIFELPDPGEAVGESLTAREMLSRGAARAERELAAQPGVQSELMATIARVYEGIGLYDDAERLALQALEIQQSLYGPDDPRVAQATITLALALQEQGELERADDLLAQAVGIYRKQPADLAEAAGGGETDGLAAALNEWGHNHHLAGDYPGALERYVEARQRYEARGETKTSAYFEVIGNLAQVYELQGKFPEAEQAYRRTLAFQAEALPEGHPTRIDTTHNLAVVLHQVGKFDEAARYYQLSLDMERQAMGEDHPALGTTLANFGRMYHEQGQLDRAEPLYRQALAHTLRTRGEDHPFVAYDKVNLARLLTDLKNPGAGALFEEALAHYARTLDAGHPYVASAQIAYARYLNEAGQPAAAREAALAGLAICEQALPADHWLAAEGLSELGQSHLAQGDLAAAGPLLEKSVPLLTASRGAADQRTRRATERLSRYQAQLPDNLAGE
ncbi:MAG: serine/threonine-protein kinase, partial [Pseudomonadota bacterium]